MSARETNIEPPGRPLLRPLRDLAFTVSRHVRTRLWLQIIVGMVLGIGTGLAFAPTGLSLVPADLAHALGRWLALPGQIFLGLIQMIVMPLVVTSIVLGIGANEEIGGLRRVGLRLLPYFLMTTTVAVTLGLGLGLALDPGRFVSDSLLGVVEASGTTVSTDASVALEGTSLPERIAGLIPQNPLAAALDQSMLEVVVFSLLIGVALVSIPNRRAQPLLELAGSVQELSMKVVSWAMYIAPVAVFGLLAQVTIEVGLDALAGVSAYVGTVLLGLLCLVVFHLLVVAFVARRSPARFLAAARDAQLLAFSTSSSAAVMPLSIQTAEEELGVSPSISQLVIPLGATVNMDGTALYQVVAAVFLTRVFGVELSHGELVLLTITVLGASIGSPSAPGVGIVILATILQGVGVPAVGITLIIGVDRVLDMSRTVVNVTGDLTACVVLERWVGGATAPPSDARRRPVPDGG